MEAPRLDVQCDFPCAFQCTSGEFLFGQMQCIIEGMNSSLHDGMYVCHWVQVVSWLRSLEGMGQRYISRVGLFFKMTSNIVQLRGLDDGRCLVSL
jgi:hypothetical protein